MFNLRCLFCGRWPSVLRDSVFLLRWQCVRKVRTGAQMGEPMRSRSPSKRVRLVACLELFIKSYVLPFDLQLIHLPNKFLARCRAETGRTSPPPPPLPLLAFSNPTS